MSKSNTIEDPGHEWEDGSLGRDEAHVARASEALRAEIDAATGMLMVSLRLQKSLVDELKLIAEFRGIGYQPLMRDVLGRFARTELMQVAKELQDQRRAHEEIEAARQSGQRRA